MKTTDPAAVKNELCGGETAGLERILALIHLLLLRGSLWLDSHVDVVVVVATFVRLPDALDAHMVVV
jgi:hypothetical protein